MNDPKVEALYYRFVSDNPNDQFDDAKPQAFTLQEFNFSLEKAILTVRPQIKYSSVDQAREKIDPILRKWEFSAFIENKSHRIRFVFQDANIVDLNPDTKGVAISLRSAYMVGVAESVTVNIQNPDYPSLINSYTTSELTDELTFRLKQYTDRNELPTQMAYYILERLEYILVGKTKNARKKLAEILIVDFDVLQKLGELSNRSDPKIGRHGNREPLPLTQDQINWLEQVAFRLVARVAEYNNDKNNLKSISMKDLIHLNT